MDRHVSENTYDWGKEAPHGNKVGLKQEPGKDIKGQYDQTDELNFFVFWQQWRSHWRYYIKERSKRYKPNRKSEGIENMIVFYSWSNTEIKQAIEKI